MEIKIAVLENHDDASNVFACYRDRREDFLDLFRTLRPKFDEEDGMMEETQFLASVIDHAEKPFTRAEIDIHMEYLYKEGKVMKSDGMLYVID